jgi:hypothetical protein
MTELEFDAQLRALADQLEYPPTPDIAGRVRARLQTFPSPSGRGVRGEGHKGHPRFSSKAVAWSLTVSLILFLSLLLIPPVRAAVIEFFQVGIVRIFPSTVTPTAPAISTATPQSVTSSPTATPGAPLPSLIPLLDTIAGETKLANAQQMTGYPILLPTYPPDLGPPNHVYVQEAEGAMTILVWIDPQQPERVLMSLHFIPQGSWALHKMGPQMIRETTVNGQYAIWAEGPYPLILRGGGEVERVRLVEGHVLIWEGDSVTYRLESALDMDEAIRVAESLAPIP